MKSGARHESAEDVDTLCKAGFHAIGKVLTHVLRDIEDDAATALDRVLIGERQKRALSIDKRAEDVCAYEIRHWHNHRFRNKIAVFGEERLRKASLNLTRHQGMCALVDAVDGTDLLERGLHNWCSAMVFFRPSNPPGQRILVSFVGMPSGEIYHARCDKSGAYVFKKPGKPKRVAGPSHVEDVRDASICFYGQKTANLLELIDSGFFHRLRELESHRPRKVGKDLILRIYNLGGIPMMMKLIDCRVETARGISAVCDIHGQAAHDVVAGAFIAKKGGASLKDLNGRDISYEDLEDVLMKPGRNRLRYVLACTDSLADAVCELLVTKPKKSTRR